MASAIAAYANPSAVAPGTALPQLIHTIARAPYYEEAEISPDARHVAWVQRTPDTALQRIGSAIFVASTRGHEPAVPVSATQRTERESGAIEHALAWSPDSRSLAFLSDAQSPGQL
ncbi:MAG: PD40 domain-containing protein, partial [Sinobacteraceae bacterium]|nr:PD40 domain-containing protein [Nevskiaceae bacterium]